MKERYFDLTKSPDFGGFFLISAVSQESYAYNRAYSAEIIKSTETDGMRIMAMKEHISKRETPLGRWLPFCFYSVNFVLWIVTGVIAGAWALLWLAVLPLPALGLYLLRTRKGSE